MTKEDIKKALECCISKKDGMCKHCPNYDYKHEDCMDDVKRNALKLIIEQEKSIQMAQDEILFLAQQNQEYREQQVKQAQIDNLQFDE